MFMKKNIQQTLLWFFISLLVLSACEKSDAPLQPGNQNAGQDTSSHYVQFVLNGLPGQPTNVNGWKVKVALLNNQNQPVVTDTLLSLRYNGKYIADSIQVPAGNYQLSKFIIIDAANTSRFTTPVANSPKASLVQQPLFIGFSVPKHSMSLITLEALQIQYNDQPQLYGYPDGSFINGSLDPGSQSVNVWIHPLIKIGDIVYDSVPVFFTLTSWDINGVMSVKTSTLAGGKTALALSRNMVKYRFEVKKWGTTDEMTFTQNDLREGMTYSLGGAKAAKKLKAVLNYEWVNNLFKPQTNTTYEYDLSGRLSKTLHYIKNADNATALAATEIFEYSNGHITKITKQDDQNMIRSVSSFVYNQGGKIISITHNEGGKQTAGDVQYTSLDGGTGISGQYAINILYRYSDRYYSTNYNMKFKGGMMIEDAAVTSHNSSSLGLYMYDFNINPYMHLNLPDLFLSNHSKHNVNWQQKTFLAADLSFVPYDFEYKYDADGYPTELTRKYFNSLTRQYAYTIKTVYNY